ncbi:sentrin-specific protease 1-like [Dysidea avara]|uniref:sentrin-specific protease 1-like n=1 Tax=Dysidea avara TaxID=196820 RepID=UPI00332A8FF4
MAFLKVASNIVEEMEKVKTFTVSTFLPSSINHNADLARRWYRNIDMEQFDIWLLPMNVNDNHWILMVLRIYSHEMLIYDSLGQSNIGHVSKIKEWLSSHSVQHWKEVEATLDPVVPKQQNGYDCGVFTCIYAIHEMTKARKFLVNQGNTHDVREFITWTLMEFYNSCRQCIRQFCEHFLMYEIVNITFNILMVSTSICLHACIVYQEFTIKDKRPSLFLLWTLDYSDISHDVSHDISHDAK